MFFIKKNITEREICRERETKAVAIVSEQFYLSLYLVHNYNRSTI